KSTRASRAGASAASFDETCLAQAFAAEGQVSAFDIVFGMQAGRVEPAAALVEEIGKKAVDLEPHPVGIGSGLEAQPRAGERRLAATGLVVALEGDVEAGRRGPCRRCARQAGEQGATSAAGG